jgi:hypothetical protein
VKLFTKIFLKVIDEHSIWNSSENKLDIILKHSKKNEFFYMHAKFYEF